MPRASAGAHVDAYFAYNALVGEADGGRALPQAEYDDLRRTAERIVRERKRLFVFWRSAPKGIDCHAVGPSTKCACGHQYKAHRWMDTEKRLVGCRVPGCRCPCFRYIPGRGSRYLRCSCKHEVEDHRDASGRPSRCTKCACTGFHNSGWRCACGEMFDDHATIVCQASDLPPGSDDGYHQASYLSAAGGGVTRLTSLLHGVDRGDAAQSAVLERLAGRLTLQDGTEASNDSTAAPPSAKFPGTGRRLGGGASRRPRPEWQD